MVTFAPAQKKQLYGRVALCGPTGAGKTWTALTWATVLGKRIALVDTENRSSNYYANRFTFDVADWPPPYDPRKLTETIRDLSKAGTHDVLIVDSLSHFWEGEGGTLDIVDAAAARQQGNSYTAWKTGTPALRHLMDSLRNAPMHVIVCMRSKMEYVLTEDARTGKKKPEKLGLAPVMRAGVEYEFTVVGDLNLEHQLAITKSRCDLIADKVAQPGRAQELAETFKAWLDEGDVRDDLPPIEPETAPPVTAEFRDAAEDAAEWQDAVIPHRPVSDIKRLTPGQKAAVADLNKIRPAELRARIKTEFVEAFGEPHLLKATDLADASAWVAKQYADSIKAAQTSEETALPLDEEATA